MTARRLLAWALFGAVAALAAAARRPLAARRRRWTCAVAVAGRVRRRGGGGRRAPAAQRDRLAPSGDRHRLGRSRSCLESYVTSSSPRRSPCGSMIGAPRCGSGWRGDLDPAARSPTGGFLSRAGGASPGRGPARSLRAARPGVRRSRAQDAARCTSQPVRPPGRRAAIRRGARLGVGLRYLWWWSGSMVGLCSRVRAAPAASSASSSSGSRWSGALMLGRWRCRRSASSTRSCCHRCEPAAPWT